MANGVFQPILNQPSSPVQPLAPVKSATPGIVTTIANAAVKTTDIVTDQIVQNTLIGDSKVIEGVEPDKDLSQSLGGLTEDAIIDRELTLTQIAAARKAGMSGAKAKALVDVKTRQAINKFPLLANKIRKKTSDFFGLGVGGGTGFFKDEATPRQKLIQSMLQKNQLTLEESDNPAIVTQRINDLTARNLAQMQVADDTASLQLKENQGKAERQGLERNINKSTTSGFQASQGELNAQFAAIRALNPSDPQAALVQTNQLQSAFINALASTGTTDATRSHSNSFISIINDKFRIFREELGSATTASQAEADNRLKAYDNVMSTGFWMADTEMAALMAQGKHFPLGPVETATVALAFAEYTRTATEGGIIDSVLTNPEKFYQDLELIYSNPEGTRAASVLQGDTSDLALGNGSLARGLVKFGETGDVPGKLPGPDSYLKVLKLFGSPGAGIIVRDNPEQFDQEVATGAERVINLYAQQTVPAFNSAINELGVNGSFITLVGEEGNVRFVVRDDVDIPLGARRDLARSVSSLNSQLSPALSLMGRAAANLNGEVGNNSRAMKQIADSWNNKRKQSLEGISSALFDDITRLNNEINSVGKTRGRASKVQALATEKAEKLKQLNVLTTLPGGPEFVSGELVKRLAEEGRVEENIARRAERDAELAPEEVVPDVVPDIIGGRTRGPRGEPIDPSELVPSLDVTERDVPLVAAEGATDREVSIVDQVNFLRLPVQERRGLEAPAGLDPALKNKINVAGERRGLLSELQGIRTPAEPEAPVDTSQIDQIVNTVNQQFTEDQLRRITSEDIAAVVTEATGTPVEPEDIPPVETAGLTPDEILANVRDAISTAFPELPPDPLASGVRPPAIDTGPPPVTRSARRGAPPETAIRPRELPPLPVALGGPGLGPTQPVTPLTVPEGAAAPEPSPAVPAALPTGPPVTEPVGRNLSTLTQAEANRVSETTGLANKVAVLEELGFNLSEIGPLLERFGIETVAPAPTAPAALERDTLPPQPEAAQPAVAPTGTVEDIKSALRNSIGRVISTEDLENAANAVKDFFISPAEGAQVRLTDRFPEATQITIDEGEVKNRKGQHISYLDTEGLLTGGIGHLMTAQEKKIYPKGKPIPDSVVAGWYETDLQEAADDVQSLIGKKKVSDDVQNILTNMAFNLGKRRLRGFKDMFKAIRTDDFDKTADEMVDSLWFRQTKSRARRLVARMREQA